MTCMPRMLSSLTRTQGVRPAVASLSNKAGALQARSPSIATDKSKWAEAPQVQPCGLSRGNFVTAAKSEDLCSGPKAGLAFAYVARKPGAWIGRGLSTEGRSDVCTGSTRGTRRFAALRSARYHNSQVGVQVGFCTSIVGATPSLRQGTSRAGIDWRHAQQQQRRMYSGKDGFGGGQHFPHSDQVQEYAMVLATIEYQQFSLLRYLVLYVRSSRNSSSSVVLRFFAVANGVYSLVRVHP